MGKIVAYGDTVVDFLPLNEPGVFQQNFGGAPANVCVAASRMGVASSFCGAVGDDVFGRFLVDVLSENNIGVTNMKYTPEATTTLVFVTLDENGDRDFVFARKPGADMFYSENDIDVSLIKGAKVVHFCAGMLSCDTTLKAMTRVIELAKDAKALVSFDINYRDAHWPDKETAIRTILQFIDKADIVKLSEEEALWCSNLESIDEALEYYRSKDFITIVTLGENGAVCLFEGETERADGFKVKAVDTTGAGDAFLGTFLAQLVESGELTKANLKDYMIRSNAAAALAVSKKGAISALPNRDELDAFLKERGY